MKTFSALLTLCAGSSLIFLFSVICVWINGWVNNREASDLRRYRAHYDVTPMTVEVRHELVLCENVCGCLCMVVISCFTIYKQNIRDLFLMLVHIISISERGPKWIYLLKNGSKRSIYWVRILSCCFPYTKMIKQHTDDVVFCGPRSAEIAYNG